MLTTSFNNQNEKIIKSKTRVQKHGEVFTPIKIINMMLNQPGVKEACKSLTSTFLEPSAGEGAFLVAILNRKLDMVSKTYNKNMKKIENYSLLALSTLYGIELLEDNSQACVMNMFQEYYTFYNKQAVKFDVRLNKRVLDSAKTIISANIEQGNFLTRRKTNGKPIVFSKWAPVKLNSNTTNIKIERTEYTLNEIYEDVNKPAGEVFKDIEMNKQISLFDYIDDDFSETIEPETTKMRYVTTNIMNVYLEEMEEYRG